MYIYIYIYIYTYSLYTYIYTHIFIYFGISFSFVSVSKLFCGEILEFFVILSAILLPVKRQLFLPFLELIFKSSFKRICWRWFSIIKKFLVAFNP